MDKQGLSHTEVPGLPVFVEGPTDRDFISEVNHQTRRLNINLRDCGGRSEVLDYIVLLSDIQIKRFCAFIDIDDDSPEKILEDVQNKLEGNFDDVEKLNPNSFHVNEYSLIRIGCIGLHENEALREYGITRHAMEDHALGLLLTDEDIVPRLSTTSIDTLEQFKNALSEQKSSVEQYIGDITKSKSLIKMSLVLLGYDGTTSSFIDKILRCTEHDLEEHSFTKDVVNVLDMST